MQNIYRLALSICVCLLVWACDVWKSDQSGAKDTDPSYRFDQDNAFLIAPKLGYLNCDDSGVISRTGERCSASLSSLMEAIEPGGASGEVHFGYTLSIPIFSLFEPKGEKWQLNKNRIEMWMDLIRVVDRPVVVHIGANHFGPNVPLVEELAKDPRNLMAYPNGHSSGGKYFNFSVNMYSFSTDPNIPINYYRAKAFDAMGNALLELEREHPGLIRAVTLVGESYHLSKDIKNKMGNYFKVDFTDYSNVAKHEFRLWLKSRFDSLSELNRLAGTDFDDWSQVQPPNKDFRNNKMAEAWRHFDSFAAGQMPVIGWAICLDEGIPRVKVELDGEYQGDAIYGLNRLDVYRKSDLVKTPNVGFRYRISYKSLAPGPHQWAVKIQCPEAEDVLIGKSDFTVLSKDDVEQTRNRALPVPKRRGFPISGTVARGYLGFPRIDEVLYYNPLGNLWQEFRAYQVENYLQTSWEQFTATGFPKQKTFVAQMVPELHGSWNQAQLATENTLTADSPYQPSFMLYGGLSFTPAINEFVRGRPYGVSQFNPMTFKNPESSQQAMAFHRDNGAVFIAPYYMSASSDKGYDANDAHTEMLIDPNSPRPESRYLYESIKEFVSY